MLQAIYRKRTTHSITFFGGTPSKDLTKKMMAAGFAYDGRAKQWYQSTSTEDVLDEAAVTKAFAGE